MDDHVIGPSVAKAAIIACLVSWSIGSGVMYWLLYGDEDVESEDWWLLLYGPIVWAIYGTRWLVAKLKGNKGGE